jgi:hypothetical protein
MIQRAVGLERALEYLAPARRKRQFLSSKLSSTELPSALFGYLFDDFVTLFDRCLAGDVDDVRKTVVLEGGIDNDA